MGTDAKGGRAIQSPISLVLEQAIDWEVSVPEDAVSLDQVAEAESVFSAAEARVFTTIVSQIEAHRGRRMRPHWIEAACAKAGISADQVHNVLVKAEMAGRLFSHTHKGQLYHVTEQPQQAPAHGPSGSMPEQPNKRRRPLSTGEIDVAMAVLEQLADSDARAATQLSLSQLGGGFQGTMPKPQVLTILRALDREGILQIFVDPRIRRSAGQQVRINSETLDLLLTDREGLRALLEVVTVKGQPVK